MAGIGQLEEFLEQASVTQAAVFGAACVERACGILFWVVARDDRLSDLDLYRSALDQIWTPEAERSTPGRVSSKMIEGLRELTVGDEAVRAAAFALHGAVAMRSALRFGELGDVSLIRDCSLTVRNHAFRLGKRLGTDLRPEEEAEQECDLEEIRRISPTDLGAISQIRDRARGVARSRLELAVERYGQ